jgi:hypothetical protein
MAYKVESSGEFLGGRVDDLSATLWGPGYQLLLVGTWTGNNTLLKLYDLGDGAVFHEEQSLDPAMGGNDVALAAPVAGRAILGFKRIPGGKTSYLTWKAGTSAIADSKEAAYQDHDLELTAFHEPAHPLFRGGVFPIERVVAVSAGKTVASAGETSEHEYRREAVTIADTFTTTMSQKAIHAAAVSITGTHKMRLAIWHFEGGGELRTMLGSYPEDVSEPATRVQVVTTAEYLINDLFKGGDLVTAVRYYSQLKLIRWRYDRRTSPATLARIGEVILPEQVEDCSLTTVRTMEGVVAVTALRLAAGNLKIIGWKLLPNGSMTRWLETTTREAVSSVTCAGVRNSDLVTCVKREPGDQMRLTYWQFPFNGNPSGVIVRSADQDGDVVAWVKCLHQPGTSETHPGHTITLSRLPSNRLKLRRWRVSKN